MNISTVSHNKCCGCMACAYVCTSNAISMSKDHEGFSVPTIDNSKCTDCGVCLKKCPSFKLNVTGEVEEYYYAFSRRKDILEKSSSGGVFYSVASQIINNGGLVIGATFDKNFHLTMTGANTLDELMPMLGSKYVQCSITPQVYSMISDNIKNRVVLFSGTPCQVKAVYNIFGKNKNLILFSFICHGVPSETALKRFIKTRESKSHSKIESINFRDKSQSGWEKYHMNIRFKNSSVYSKEAKYDPYLYSFVFNASLRYSCYECPADEERIPDIIVGDFWGMDKDKFDNNNNMGVSRIIVNSIAGKELISKCSDLFVKQITYEDICEKDKLFQNAVKPESRDTFYKAIEKNNFDIAFEKCVTRNYINPIKKKAYNIKQKLLKRFN